MSLVGTEIEIYRGRLQILTEKFAKRETEYAELQGKLASEIADLTKQRDDADAARADAVDQRNEAEAKVIELQAKLDDANKQVETLKATATLDAKDLEEIKEAQAELNLDNDGKPLPDAAPAPTGEPAKIDVK